MVKFLPVSSLISLRSVWGDGKFELHSAIWVEPFTDDCGLRQLDLVYSDWYVIAFGEEGLDV